MGVSGPTYEAAADLGRHTPDSTSTTLQHRHTHTLNYLKHTWRFKHVLAEVTCTYESAGTSHFHSTIILAPIKHWPVHIIKYLHPFKIKTINLVKCIWKWWNSSPPHPKSSRPQQVLHVKITRWVEGACSHLHTAITPPINQTMTRPHGSCLSLIKVFPLLKWKCPTGSFPEHDFHVFKLSTSVSYFILSLSWSCSELTKCTLWKWACESGFKVLQRKGWELQGSQHRKESISTRRPLLKCHQNTSSP